MNKLLVRCSLVLLIVIAQLPFSCKKEEKQVPSVTTSQVSGITATAAISGGELTDEGTGPVVARGLCWSNSTAPTIDDYKSIEEAGSDNFVSRITDLKPATEYFIRAYAVNEAGIAYGEELKFMTLPIGAPSLTTKEVTNITTTSAITGGNIIDLNGGEITERGVCWNTNPVPSIENNKYTAAKGSEGYTCEISGLSPNSTYYLRAYAVNSGGISYGNEISFKTCGTPPIVITSEITSILSDHAVANGKITNDGGSPVTLRGFCWSMFQKPDTSDNKSENGDGTTDFTQNISFRSEPETKYYVRAYAKNIYGISYGNEVSFSTKKSIALFADSISGITRSQATLHGHVVTMPDLTGVTYGICWGLSVFPTIEDESSEVTPVNGTLSLQVANLKPWSVYFMRVFAKSGNQILYGNNISFSTLGKPPTVNTNIAEGTLTNYVSEGNTRGAFMGSFIISPGGSVDSYGFCWSKMHEPDIDDSQIDGALISTQSFNATVTNLEVNTDYYVRAYLKDAYGIYYGNEKTFRISYTPPVADGYYNEAYYFNKINAIYQATYTNSSTLPILKYGVCWNTSTNPTTDNSKEEVTTGNIADLIVRDLDPGITYYIRFFVTNALGTYYSSNRIITKWYGQPGPQATDADGNLYNSVKIGSQVWLIENLKTTKYLNGDAIGTTSSPSLDITGETEPKYQWPAGGVETNVPEYGRLYSWYTVTDNRKICPSGWHVPSTAEWEGLGSFLKDKGGYLKETGLTHWMAPNYGATNSSNFTARGAGYRLLSSFENMKNYAMFWTTTPSSSASAAPYVYLYYDYDVLGISYSPPSSYSSSNGFSVRCLKDN